MSKCGRLDLPPRIQGKPQKTGFALSQGLQKHDQGGRRKKEEGHACDVEVSEGPSVGLDLFLSEVFIVLVESILEEVVLAGGVTLAYNSGLLLHIYYYIINSDVI